MKYKAEKNTTVETLRKIIGLSGSDQRQEGFLVSSLIWDKDPGMSWNQYEQHLDSIIHALFNYNLDNKERYPFVNAFQEGRKDYFSGHNGDYEDLGSNEAVFRAVGYYAAYRESNKSADTKGIAI